MVQWPKRPWLLWHQRQFLYEYLNPNGTAWIQVVPCWCSDSIKFNQRLGLFISIPYMSIHFHVAAPLAVLWLMLLFTRAPALTAKGDQPGGSMFEAKKKGACSANCVFQTLFWHICRHLMVMWIICMLSNISNRTTPLDPGVYSYGKVPFSATFARNAESQGSFLWVPLPKQGWRPRDSTGSTPEATWPMLLKNFPKPNIKTI